MGMTVGAIVAGQRQFPIIAGDSPVISGPWLACQWTAQFPNSGGLTYPQKRAGVLARLCAVAARKTETSRPGFLKRLRHKNPLF